MSALAEPKACLKCGRPLGGLAPEGVCARCLLLTGIAEPDDEALEQTAPRDAPRFSPELPRQFGDYELLDEIARGGMGIVYKARQVSLDRLVAVKMLLFGHYTSEESIHRFRIEASAAASLQHPNIVAIHEVGVHQGQHYFAMDFVDGPNLAQFIRDQPLPFKRAAAYVKTIAEAIQFAHQRRILHRDLKPSNILIDSNDRPRITDFGLAKRLPDSKRETPNSELTLTGQTIGSPNYIPPEQASVQRGKIGPHSDVYSLGAILYHSLTGRPPFLGETLADTLQQVLNTDPIAPRRLRPTVPAELETICLKCLEKETSKRYASAQELADELGRFLRDETIFARPVTPIERGWRWCRRKPALAGLFFLLLLVGTAGLTGILWESHRKELQRVEAQQDLYVANVKSANDAMNEHDLSSARQFLGAIDRSPAQRAMRDWAWRYVANRALSGEYHSLGRHDSWLADLAVSPDQLRAATISEDGMVKLWDLMTEKEIASWSAHAHEIKAQPDWCHHAAVFTPDGATLVTAGQDGTVCAWDVNARNAKPAPRFKLTGLKNAVNRLAISPDGTLLAGQCWRDQVFVWQLTNGLPRLMAELPYEAVVPFAVAFAPDGKSLLVGWTDKPILRYELSQSGTPCEPEKLLDSYPPFAFSPDGHWLVTAGDTRHVVRRWSWPERVRLPDLHVEGGMIDGFAFSPNTRLLAAGLLGGQINLWIATNREAQTPSVLLGHEAPIVSVALAQKRDQVKMVSTSTDKTVRLWQLNSAARNDTLLSLGTPVLAVAISPNGLLLATVINTPVARGEESVQKPFTLALWDFKTRSLRKSVAFGGKDLNPQILFSPDSHTVSVTDFGQLEHYKVPSLELELQAGRRGLAYAPNGGGLVYLGDKGITKRRFLASSETVLVLGMGDLQQLALSPDGRALAGSETAGANIWLWDARDGRSLGPPLPGHTLRIVALGFTPDSATLVSAGWDGQLGIWDVQRHENRAFLRGHNNYFTQAVLSPDGRIIATGGDDNAVRLWNVARAQEIAVLRGHGDTVNDLAFSKDGRWLASASSDGTVRFWEAPLLEEIEATEQSRE